MYGDHTIKRRDLGGYKEIVTYESCSYEGPRYSHTQRQLGRYKYILFSIEKRVPSDYLKSEGWTTDYPKL